MRKLWISVGLVALVGLLGVTVLGAVAFAQAGQDGASSPFDLRQKMHDAIAGVLGVEVEEYDAAVDTAREQVLDEAVEEGVLTQEQAELMSERWAQGTGPGGFGRRGGMMGRGGMIGGGYGGMLGSQSSLLSVAAETLSMSVEDLAAELQNDKTIADVAAEKGVEPQAIVDAFVAPRAEWLADAVADGRITQEQADLMLNNMEEQALAHLSAPYTGSGTPGDCFGDQQGGSWQGRGGMRGGMMGPGGGFRSFPGTDES